MKRSAPHTLKWTSAFFGGLAANPQHEFARLHAQCLYRAEAIYSFIPKNACSTLRYSVALFNGAIRDEKDLGWIHRNNHTFAAAISDLARAKYAFIVLRDPYTRIVSCFLDKMINVDRPLWSLWESLDRPWQPMDLTFRIFIDAISQRVRLDGHWRPQSDFLIFDDYDDYFAFENMPHVTATLKKRIGLDVRDTREALMHGSERWAGVDESGCLADVPISKLQQWKHLGKLPKVEQLLDQAIVDKIVQIYGEDITLYKEKCGLPVFVEK